MISVALRLSVVTSSVLIKCYFSTIRFQSKRRSSFYRPKAMKKERPESVELRTLAMTLEKPQTPEGNAQASFHRLTNVLAENNRRPSHTFLTLFQP